METTEYKKSAVWSAGLAMFAMFFGAGNIVFPLALGQFAQGQNFYGIVGLILTAVLVPLMGLLSMILYRGDYFSFFKRIGAIPGFVVIATILAVIGPFGGIPRCITISYSTLGAFGIESIKGVNLLSFSVVSCLLIFLFTCRPTRILTLLGYVLTPVLLISLGLIAVKGLFAMPPIEASRHAPLSTFSKGLFDGYNTMDLLAAFFFSSVVLNCLRGNKQNSDNEGFGILKVAFKGSLIAAFLLATVYVSFSFLAAGYSKELEGIAAHELLGTLAYQLLGPYAGMIAGVAVCFACLTTEIALAAVVAEFLQKIVFKEKISYRVALGLTLCISLLISTLRFEGISALLCPILQICYPALIVLSILNLIHKLGGFKPTKRIFYVVIAMSVATYLVIHAPYFQH